MIHGFPRVDLRSVRGQPVSDHASSFIGAAANSISQPPVLDVFARVSWANLDVQLGGSSMKLGNGKALQHNGLQNCVDRRWVSPFQIFPDPPWRTNDFTRQRAV
jgi:hypothetical protein